MIFKLGAANGNSFDKDRSVTFVILGDLQLLSISHALVYCGLASLDNVHVQVVTKAGNEGLMFEELHHVFDELHHGEVCGGNNRDILDHPNVGRLGLTHLPKCLSDP